jgi:hypothetical protein
MELLGENKYIAFWVDTKQPETKKTKVVHVVNKHHDETLGEIRWFSKWRQYCFYPYDETIWNVDCLGSITGVIRGLMLERRMKSAIKKNQ